MADDSMKVTLRVTKTDGGYFVELGDPSYNTIFNPLCVVQTFQGVMLALQSALAWEIDPDEDEELMEKKP